MKILLVGNYELSDQKSMPRFGEMMRRELAARGQEVMLLRPRGVLGGLGGGAAGGSLGKWLSYVDQYLIFPFRLWEVSGKRWDAVHICDHSNAVYRPWVRGRKPSVTCHDVLAIQAADGLISEQRLGRTGKVQQRWIKRNLLKLTRVACVSTKTKEDLRALGSEAEIEVIPNPLNNDFAPSDEATVAMVRTETGLAAGEVYALQVGGNLWYKNRRGVVRIFAELRKLDGFAGMKLVMAGHAFSDELRGEVERLGLGDAVVELKDPDDRTVRALYTGAAMLLFPSLYEGFGWPIVEAQSCGCLVVTSRREPMMEVAGGAAILVDPVDAVGAAQEIAVEWKDRAAIRAEGFKNVQRFGRQEIMERYERFLEGGR